MRYTYTVAEELHIATITVDPDRPLDGCTGQFELRARGDCRLIRHAQTPERAAGRAGVSAAWSAVASGRDADGDASGVTRSVTVSRFAYDRI